MPQSRLIEPTTTVRETAARLERGDVRATALLDACLAAIAAQDGTLHAMLTRNPSARQDAEAADRAIARGDYIGPLHGIPLVVKDNIDMLGLPTTSGCIGLKDAIALRDADQISRLRAAGAIIVGKTNLSEFSFEIRSRSSLGGDVLHPLNQTVTPGGSSGGTAVAVAAGYALAGLGTDTGGSIRVPAAYTGLVGFRPAHGSLSLAGVAPLAPSADTIGPIARCVDDIEILLAAMGQTFAPASEGPKRIGILRQAFGQNTAIASAAERAAATLAQAGHSIIDPVTLPDDLIPSGGDHIVDAEFADAFDHYLATNFAPGSTPASLSALIDSGAHLPEYGAVLNARLDRKGRSTAPILAEHRRLTDALHDLVQHERLDALLFPTSQTVPISLDNPKGGWGPELAARSGWPAFSVPSGTSLSGLPIGIELLAPRGHEPILFHLARQIEASNHG